MFEILNYTTLYIFWIAILTYKRMEIWLTMNNLQTYPSPHDSMVKFCKEILPGPYFKEKNKKANKASAS